MINATGLQTNAIVVSIRVELAEEFESLFAAEELPIWDEFQPTARWSPRRSPAWRTGASRRTVSRTTSSSRCSTG